MAKWDKFQQKLNSGQSDNTIPFDDLVTYVGRLGWTPCGGDGGSHRKFSHSDCVGLINIQKRSDGMAKSYQVEQVRNLLAECEQAKEQKAQAAQEANNNEVTK